VRPLQWFPTPGESFQYAHVVTSLALCWFPPAALGASVWWGFGAALAWGVAKEAYDTWAPPSWPFAEQDDLTDSLIDLAFYAAGAVAGLLVALLGVWLRVRG
jgi:hypothetical protein